MLSFAIDVGKLSLTRGYGIKVKIGGVRVRVSWGESKSESYG